MLKYYIKRSATEGYQPVATPPRDAVWVRGDSVSEADLAQLDRLYGMDANVLRDVLDVNELPRVELRKNGLYVFIRSPATGKHGKIVTRPVLLVLKGTVFVSLSLSVIEAYNHATSGSVIPLRSTASLLLSTFVSVLGEYEVLMQHTAHSIHDTSGRLRTHEVTNDDFIRFATVEDNLNEYKMNLGGMRVVAERLKEIFPHNGDGEAIEDIVLYIRQLLVAIESYEQSIVSIRNAYGTIANNVLNQRMKTLTLLTLLVALPNVLYGMYGMNIGLPFADEPWAYGAIVAVTLLVIVFVIVIAKRRNIL